MGRLKQMPARLARLAPKVRAMPKRAEGFYQSAEWREYRREHRAWTARTKGGVWCSVCGAGGRLILDHKVERRDGGEDFPRYEGAEWLCTGCHNAKTAAAKAARAGKVGGGRKSGKRAAR